MTWASLMTDTLSRASLWTPGIVHAVTTVLGPSFGRDFGEAMESWVFTESWRHRPPSDVRAEI